MLFLRQSVSFLSFSRDFFAQIFGRNVTHIFTGINSPNYCPRPLWVREVVPQSRNKGMGVDLQLLSNREKTLLVGALKELYALPD
jgi:hypothetical protein